jgi:hypothetical protein
MIHNLERMIELGSTPENAMRKIRDSLLAASDWTQTLDAPITADQRAAWATYRQALRDAPANWTPAETWDAPDPPEAPA